MSRFDPPDHSEWSEEQSTIESRAYEQMFRAFPQLESKDANGKLLGPYPSLYYTPDLVAPFFTIANAVVHQPRFTSRQREVAVLAVLAVHDSPYPLYAHSQIALAVGLTRDQIEQAVNGTCPAGLSGDETAVYSLALELASSKGPLSEQAFFKARQVLGQSKIAGLTHLVASYLYVSLLSNIGDCTVPKPREGVYLANKKH